MCHGRGKLPLPSFSAAATILSPIAAPAVPPVWLDRRSGKIVVSATISNQAVGVADQRSARCDFARETAILNMSRVVYYGLEPIGASIWSLVQAPRSVVQVQNTIVADVEPAVRTPSRRISRGNTTSQTGWPWRFIIGRLRHQMKRRRGSGHWLKPSDKAECWQMRDLPQFLQFSCCVATGLHSRLSADV